MLPTTKPIYLFLFFSFVVTNIWAQNTSFKSEDELMKSAASLFDAKDFEQARPLYSQLLSLYPKKPEYNYKYGTCLLIAGNDREQALEYIQYGMAKGQVEIEAYFYLGKAYHMNYDFDKAINSYQKFKDRASSAKGEEFKVDHQIRMCQNGKNLLKKFKGVKVLQKQDMSYDNFYRIYALTGLKGQLLAKPEKFMSKHDKKVNESSIMFFPENATELYFSSYGSKGENGKDIFKVILLENGKWSDPINLGSAINTPYDEDFAFLHPETQTLFFASTGHNSMGGYDLFKSTYDPDVASWKEAENLDFPYSTVDNDYMFVEVPGNPIAYFASDRFKGSGKTAVYKVNTLEVEPELAILKGRFRVEGIPEITKATITVKDEKGRLISKIETDKNTDYEIAFHQNGGTYVFNLETTDESPIHSGKIELPKNSGLNVYSQELVLKGSLENQTLLIKNDFKPIEKDKKELNFSPEVLKTQANLEVNSTEESIAAAGKVGSTGEVSDQKQLADVNKDAPKSIDLRKEEINTAIEELKDINSASLDQHAAMEQAAYQKAEEYRSTAESLYAQANAESDRVISERQRGQANENAATAITMVEIASELQGETEILKREQNAIKDADKEISDLLLSGDIVQAEKRMNVFKNSVKPVSHSQLMANKLSNAADKTKAASSDLETIESKIEKTIYDQKNIEKQIADLENEKETAKKKRKEEIDTSLKTYTLDLKDHEYRLKMLADEQEKEEEVLAKSMFKQKSWQEVSQVDLSTSSKVTLSEKQRVDTESKVSALSERERPFSSVGNQNNMDANSLAEQSGSFSEDQKSSRDQQTSQMQSTYKDAQETEDKNIEQALGDKPASISEDKTPVSSKNSVTKTPAGTQASVRGKEGGQRVQLDVEEQKRYTLQASQELAEEAADLKQQSTEKFREYNDLLISLKSLPTEEERTIAFEKAHHIQESARKMELQAAVVKGKANQIQFLRNKAQLRSMTDSPIPSSKTNMILLISDEAGIYYEQAESIRVGLDTSERYSKLEAGYMDALVYEEKALKKQEQALQMMDVRKEQVAKQEVAEVKREEAGQSADVLQQESAVLMRKVNELRNQAKNETAVIKKDSLLALATVQEDLAAKKLIQANVLYSSSRISDENSKEVREESKQVLINVISEPGELDSTILASVSESEKNEIISTPDFSEFQKIYAEKEDLIRKTNEVHEKAVTSQLVIDSLEQRKTALRSSALIATTEEEKAKMVLEAFVIDSRVESLNSSIDSANKIIKLRNFLIQRKDQGLKQKLAEMDNETQAERIVLMAQVVYAENQAILDKQVDLVAQTIVPRVEADSRPLVETGSVENKQDVEVVVDTREENELAEELNGREHTTQSTETVLEDESWEHRVAEEVEIVENETEKDEIVKRNEIVEARIPSQDDFTKTETETDKASSAVESSERKEEDMAFIPRGVKSNVFDVRRGSSSNYSNANPIPIDPTFPEGVIYQVQVGAFRNPIPQDHFQGFAPLMGVTGSNGITRYTAGMFNDFPQADQAKSKIRELGYSDAFVVAFQNGKRISVDQARNFEQTGVSVNEVFSAGESRVKQPQTIVRQTVTLNESANDEAQIVDAKSSTSIEGTYFSIQVGVFSKPLSKDAADYDGFLIVDKLESGLYRYHVGIFDNLETAKQAQKANLSKDIPDSFVVAYHNGKRISISQATAIIMNK